MTGTAGQNGSGPVSPELAGVARPFVDRAVLRFKSLRDDFERIGSAVVAAMKDGLIDRETARTIWIDHCHILSVPLIERYLQAGKFEQIAAWLRVRPAMETMDWPDEPARVALAGFIANGQGALAAQLCRHHIERMMRKLRRDWKERRRNPSKGLDEDSARAFRALQRQIVADIPTRNVEMLLDIAAVEAIVATHGSDEDRAFLAAVRAEVEEDQRRFPSAC